MVKENKKSFKRNISGRNIFNHRPEFEPENVTNMVGTFLNEDKIGFQKIRVTTTQVASEKVVTTVTTFSDAGGLVKLKIY